MFTEIIGWVGVGIGIFVAVPQFRNSVKDKSNLTASLQPEYSGTADHS